MKAGIAIGGGVANEINDNAAAVTGGECNQVLAGGAHSFIGGGMNNTVTGPCSAILGGSGNSDGGLANVHIVGSGIAAVNANALQRMPIVCRN